MKTCKRHKWTHPLIDASKAGNLLKAEHAYFIEEVLMCARCFKIKANLEHIGMLKFVRAMKKEFK